MTDLFITDVIAYYVRMGFQPVCFQVYAVKVGATTLVPSRGPARACRALLLAELCKANGLWGLLADLSLDVRAPQPVPSLPGSQVY